MRKKLIEALVLLGSLAWIPLSAAAFIISDAPLVTKLMIAAGVSIVMLLSLFFRDGN